MGEVPANLGNGLHTRTKISSLILAVIFFPFTTSAQSVSWHQCTGPYGGGFIHNIVLDSSGDSYAAVGSFGIYMSTDDGITWKQESTGLTDFDFEWMAALPGDTMLVATYKGIFRSTGLAAGWSLVNSDFIFNEIDSIGWVSSMQMGPDGRVYAGTASGLMCSTDKGTTWSVVSSETSPVYALTVAPSGRMYAGVHSGVIMSTDGGSTWKGFAEFPYTDQIVSIAIMPNGDVAVPYSSGIEFFGADGGSPKGTYPASEKSFPPGIYYESFLATVRTPSETTSADLYSGTSIGLYRFPADSTSWEKVPLDSTGPYITTISVRGGTILVGSGGGIYRSANYGASWMPIANGLAALQITGLTVAKPQGTANPAGIVFAAATNWFFRSTDNGNNWFLATSGLKVSKPYATYTFAAGPTGILYASAGYGGFTSSDGGTSWNSLDGAPNYSSGIAAVRGGPPGDSLGLLITVGRDGMYTSTDGGLTWVVGVIGYDLQGSSVSDFAFLPYDSAGSEGGYVFAGGGYGVFRSSDFGVTWYLDISGLQGHPLTSLCVPFNPSTGHSSNAIYGGSANGGGTFVSTDYGLHWNPVGLSNRTVYCLAGTRDGSVFAGTDSGVFAFVNPATRTWNPEDDGLIGSAVTSLAVDSLGYLYAATEKGVFRSNGIIDAVTQYHSDTPKTFVLSQNFPNPFNPTTAIPYSIPNRSRVTIRIYDMLGRLVSTLVDGVQPPGNHIATWNASKEASGAYLTVMDVGGRRIARKILLLK